MRLEDWCGGQCQADHDDTAGVLHGYYSETYLEQDRVDREIKKIILVI